jgi:threonine synthase
VENVVNYGSKLNRRGSLPIPADQSMVVVLTGSGLKAAERIAELLGMRSDE